MILSGALSRSKKVDVKYIYIFKRYASGDEGKADKAASYSI